MNKFREPGHVFHPKEAKGLGFVITMDGTRVYYAGDTDFIPEMNDIAVDIALLAGVGNLCNDGGRSGGSGAGDPS